MLKSIFSKERTLYSSKEVGAEFNISEPEMQAISRVFKIGEKIGYWVYNLNDVERLKEILDMYGRKDDQE